MAAEELKTIVIFANTIGFKSIVFNSLNSFNFLNSSNIRNLNKHYIMMKPTALLLTSWRATLFALFALLLPSAAWAQYGGGSGSQWDPYIIKTTDHMTALADAVNGGNNYLDTYFRLDADLDYTGKTYTIIGDYDKNDNAAFCGKFDGNGHTISGVQINRTASAKNSTNIGLFGTILFSAVIENLTLSASTIKGRCFIGGIVGCTGEGYSTVGRGPTVRNCHVTDDVTLETIDMKVQGSSGWQYSGSLGGIIGYVGFSPTALIGNCTSAATIIASTRSEAIGGIVGDCGKKTPITGCTFTGTISGGTGYVGGILGWNYKNTATLTDCYVGGNCAIGAVGVEGSATGTDEGYDVKHLYTIRFNSAQLTNGTIDTPPTMTINGIGYYAEGTVITLSNVTTFGSPSGSGMMWNYRAEISGSSSYVDVLLQEDGTWQFTMPAGNVLIYSKGAKDLRLTEYPNTTRTSVTPASVPYTSNAQKPVVSVVCRANDLVEGTDFITDIPAEGFTAEGKYAIKIWGIGEYGGLRTDTFTIGKPWEGEGTQASPFLIKSTDDMERLATIVRSGEKYEGVYFRQAADLDFTGKAYTPVGYFDQSKNEAYYFSGNYDGGYYTIIGINVSGVYWAGVFGATLAPATISNITLEGNCFFNSTNSSGGIVGYNNGEISGCRIVSSNVVVKGEMFVGSIAGQSYGSVNYCESMATVELTESAYTSPVLGGLVGAAYKAVTGDFSGTVKGRGTIGGLVGHAVSYEAEISGRNLGEIITTNSSSTVGGIVGNADDNSMVASCTNACLMRNVSGTNVGAIIGVMNTSADAKAMNNYYIGACKYGGITGTDVLGKAMRGWPISHEESIGFFPIPDANDNMVGTYYDDGTSNNYYVGAGETLRFVLVGGTDYTANGSQLIAKGYDSNYEANYYELTMEALPVHIMPTGLTLTLYDGWSNEHNVSDIGSALGEERDVIISGRTLYRDGTWQTLCLPFDLDEGALATSPLAGAEVRTLSAASYDAGTLTLTFNVAANVMAGVPFIFRYTTTATDLQNPRFSQVRLATTDAQTQRFDENRVAFVGTFAYKNLATTDKSLLAFSQASGLYYPATDATEKALRGYFTAAGKVRTLVTNIGLDFDETYSPLAGGFYRLRRGDSYLAQAADGTPVYVSSADAPYDASTIFTLTEQAGGTFTLTSQARGLTASGFANDPAALTLDMDAADAAYILFEGVPYQNQVLTFEANPTLRVKMHDAGGEGFATGYYPFAVKVDAVDAATVEVSSDGKTAHYSSIATGEVPAATGVLFVGDETEAVLMPIAAADPVQTDLTGHYLETNVPDALVFNILENVPGFYALKSGSKLDANKAYLPMPVQAVRALTLQPAVTGVTSAMQEDASGAYYDLQGRRISSAAAKRGIYIQSGKKVMTK